MFLSSLAVVVSKGRVFTLENANKQILSNRGIFITSVSFINYHKFYCAKVTLVPNYFLPRWRTIPRNC